MTGVVAGMRMTARMNRGAMTGLALLLAALPAGLAQAQLAAAPDSAATPIVAAMSAPAELAPLSEAAPLLSPFAQALADAVAETPALAQFYQAHDYATLWTGEADAARRVALFQALDGAAAHGLPAARYDAGGLRSRIAAIRTEGDRARAEAALSAAFLSYARDVSSGALVPTSVDPMIVRDLHRPEPLDLIEGFAAADPGAFLRALPPSAPQYAQLMKARVDLERTVASGGWGPVVPGGILRPGDRSPRVVALRDRLVAMGYLAHSAVASYDGSIQKAVQAFQADHGLVADGVAGEGTLSEINTGPEVRLGAVLAAMERLRWMNHTPLGDRYIWVNLPDFTAKIIDHDKVVFRTVAVVGMDQDDRRTPEFSDQMEYMVVNPSWHVPRSITVKEYLPMLQRNPNAAAQIDIVDRAGNVVPRDAVDWRQFTPKTFPFIMKQKPSDANALGLVKFMFPNKWNIYLHDTPSKALFGKEMRAFSHGCIRLQKPFDFAYQLLGQQTDDPEGQFQRVLATGKESTISLKEPVPVHLVYFTAWPTARGHMEYRRDVYGRDQAIFDKLQQAGLVLGLQEG